MSLNSLGWITGRILSEAGAVDVFELDQDLDATPTRYITLDQEVEAFEIHAVKYLMDPCLLYTSPSPRDGLLSRMPSSA